MFGPRSASVWLVVDEGFHADGDEGECRVVVWAVEVCIGGYFWVHVALAEEEELAFRLGDDLAPQPKGESMGSAAEDRNKMVLPKLDRLLGDVAAVVVGRYKLVRHTGVCDGFFVLGRRFVVKNLVFGAQAGGSHSGEAAAAGSNHGILRFAREGFNPGCVGVDLVHGHLVFVPAAGSLRERPGLV